MSSSTSSQTRGPWSAAREGAAVWAMYGIAELAVLAWLPWLRTARDELRALNPLTSLALLALYPLAGAVLAAIGARVWKARWGAAGVSLLAALAYSFLRTDNLGWQAPLELVSAFGAAAAIRLWLGPRALAALYLGAALSAPLLTAAPWVAPERTPAAAAAPADAPNLLLIVLDTVRADHLPLYGYDRDTTPNLTRFAKGPGGVAFRLTSSTADVTLTSHASMFTGQYGLRHGAHYGAPGQPEGTPLPDSATTLAEVLADHGWATEAVVANHGFLSPAFGFTQGFERFDYRMPTPLLAPAPAWSLRARLGKPLARHLPRVLREKVFRDAAEITDAVSERIDRLAEGKRPWFMMVNYMDAHAPYLPPAPFDTRWPGKDPEFSTATDFAVARQVNGRVRQLRKSERDHMISQYDGGLLYMDSELGRLFAHLEARGVLDRTFVVVTSDHGEVFGARQLVGHVVSVYEDQVHVPLVMHGPGSERLRSDVRASGVDLMPTLLEVAGLEVPEGLDGCSLFHPAERSVFAESYPEPHRVEISDRFDRVQRAVYAEDHKLVWSSRGQREVYDLETDPHENHDLGPDARLEALLQAWTASAPTVTEQPSKDVDANALERLRALGYAQ